ncbi:MAG TPA: hypothetical protein VJN64_14835 [Terriglobales bacterium]|nr:hypothetical protein [Terriglobales bacterium]
MAKHALKLFSLAVIFTTAAALAQQPSAPVQTEPKATPVADSTKQSDGPFGFQYGMTRQQVIDKLGKGAIVDDSDGHLAFNTAPNPHPDFSLYVVVFSPEKGLLKVSAISNDIVTAEDGAELKSKFHYIRDALIKKYGKAEQEFDFCKGNDVECQSQFYMMELQDKNRVLSSFWSTAHSSLPGHIHTILVDTKSANLHSGYITLSYEFDGWDAFMAEQNKKRDSAF